MKHKIKNIANRPIPVDGTKFKPVQGEVVEAEITPRLETMIKNGFFEDLGVVEEKKKAKEKKEEKEFEKNKEAWIDARSRNINKATDKESKKKKKKKKKKSFSEEMI